MYGSFCKIPLFLAVLCFCSFSCKSTRVYEKTSTEMLQDGKLIGKETVLLLDGKEKESSSEFITMTKVGNIDVEAYTEKTSKLDYETMNIKLYKDGSFISEKKYKLKDGNVSAFSDSTQTASNTSSLADKDRKYLEVIDYSDFVFIECNESMPNFFIAKTEVTQEEYQKVMDKNPSANVGEKKPVESVTFFDALEYCNRRSQMENLTPAYTVKGDNWIPNPKANGYRLPTLEEWHYVADGGKFASGFKYSGGDIASDVAWTKKNSKKTTQDVATKKANKLGVYDMSGNVFEWCWSETDFVACGGSFSSDAMEISDYFVLRPDAYIDTGFRVVRTVGVLEQRTFAEKMELLGDIDQIFKKATAAVMEAKEKSLGVEDSGVVTLNTVTEQATVESVPNSNYIVYSIIGKPFVFIGSSLWNLLKCSGYAFLNFGGGAATVQGKGFIWKMPDVKGAKAKAQEAKVNNKIEYPEYHLPFTDNHITVEKTTTETKNAFSKTKKEVAVLSKEQYEYDNTISVSRSAQADANSTAATVGLVGTVLTVPVSAVAWVGGVAAGAYAKK